MTSRTLILIAIAAGTIALAAWLNEEPAAAPVPAVATATQAAPHPQQRWSSSTPAGSGIGLGSGLGLGARAPQANPVYGRNGRVVDLGGKNVADYIAARMSAARSGNVKASYEAYQAASICATNDDPVGDYHDPAERAAFLRERERLVALCAGMSAAQVQERMGFLSAAARAGHLGAQVDFYMEGPYGREVDISQHPDDPIVKQWKTDALAHLEQAGSQCDHFSLALLSTLYDAGQLTARDMAKSMAYSIAADVPRKKVQTEEQLRARFGDALSAEQFASARALGAQISRAACPPPRQTAQ